MGWGSVLHRVARRRKERSVRVESGTALCWYLCSSLVVDRDVSRSSSLAVSWRGPRQRAGKFGISRRVCRGGRSG